MNINNDNKSDIRSQISAVTNCTNVTFANVHRLWK